MDFNFIILSVVKILVVFVTVLTAVAYSVLLERKVCSFIQDRIGPNRTVPPIANTIASYIPIIGPRVVRFLTRLGIFQPLADGAKLFIKEDLTPGHVRKFYYWLAPALAVVPSFLTFAVIPFGAYVDKEGALHRLVIADLDVGILYTFGIVSLAVYAIVLAGYASNSKYPFFGGIRSSAQMISYELAMGMSVIPVFMHVGNLNLSEVVNYQGANGWLILWLAPSFLIFLVAAFAETNRLPFDMPECETELVGGYNTEYSSMKFGLFFLGEYAAMISVSALITTLFLGGWNFPGVPTEATNLFWGLVQIGVFCAKVFAIMVFFVWIRWTLPRFRYDQLMNLGWKGFLPLALLNIFVTAVLLMMNLSLVVSFVVLSGGILASAALLFGVISKPAN